MDQQSSTTPPAQADTAATGEQNTGATNLGAAPAEQAAAPPADKASENPETKTTEAKPTEAKAEDKPAGAPESYEFQAPEGFELDQEILGEAAPLMKEANLPQEQAQKFVDIYAKGMQKAVQQTAASVLAEVGLADRDQWASAVQTDKEIGGEKLAENLAFAQKAVNAFGSPELREMFLKTGVGAHPELVKAFVRIGKQISEDSFVPGGKTASPQDAASRMYSASKMNP